VTRETIVIATRSLLVALLACAAVLVAWAPASALVMSADDPKFGPGSLTVDLATGYHWLDVTHSINRSIAGVSAQLGLGGDFEGFRYATQAEVTAFFESAGLSIGFGFPPERHRAFTDMVGLTESNATVQRTVAWVSTLASPGQHFAPDVGVLGGSGFANPSNCCVAEDAPFPNAGSWLVRTVVAADDPRHGPGSITIDLVTGYHWLDVTRSINRSIQDVSAHFGPGGDFEGFRHGTKAEVTALFQDAGLDIGAGASPERYQVFTGLVGLTETTGGVERTVGRVSTQSAPGQHFAPDVGTIGGTGFANPDNCCALPTLASPNAGSWLVRTVVAADDARFGPGSITVDLVTGHQWLDVTRSVNRSIADVSTQFGPDGDFAGFRYATKGEVTTFFQDAGLSIGFNFPTAPYRVFTGLVGLTENGTLSQRTVGWVSTQAAPGQHWAPDVGLFAGAGFANPDNCCATQTLAIPTAGSFLVRTPARPTAPTIDTTPTNPTNQSDASFGFSSVQGGVSFLCRVDAGAFTPCDSPATYSGLAHGSHTFTVKARDPFGVDGDAASFTWMVIDITPPPAPTITATPANPTNQTSATFSFADDEAGASFLCQLDGSAFTACTSGKSYAGLARGTHTFSVKAQDALGNQSAAASFSWTIDTIAPARPTITARPASPTSSDSATFGFASIEAGVSFLCQLDGGGFSECASPHTYSGIGAGSHTFSVKARDAAGNQSVATSATWTIDLTPPVAPTITRATITGTPPTHGASFTFAHAERGVSFLCALDGNAFTPCTSGKTYAGLSPGSHTFSVKAQDATGNQGPAASFAWTMP
jgi:hypothetical protein